MVICKGCRSTIIFDRVTDKYGMNHTDFSLAFQEGYTFKYKVPFDEVNDVTFSVHPIGELVLTSGKLVACDPLLTPDLRQYFTQELKPGRYPVILSVAAFRQRGEKRIACAMLRIGDGTPVRWEAAWRACDDSIDFEEGDIPGYGVDSGTGGFMDLDAAQVLHTLYQEDLRMIREQDYQLPDRFDEEYCQKLIAEMEKNQAAAISDEYPYSREGDWANIGVSDTTEANVIAFSSGWGDGGYASYWGYDAQDKLICLVTDFTLFVEEDEDEDEI